MSPSPHPSLPPRALASRIVRRRLATAAGFFLLPLSVAMVTETAPLFQTQPQPSGPPVRLLGEASHVSKVRLASVAQVRALSGGRVLVNDAVARQLLLLDSTLQLIKVVADSTAGDRNVYGVRAGRLLPYRGDSSMLIDAASLSMLVLDGNGEIAGVTSTPHALHITYLTGATYGNPGIDAQGRLIYRIVDPTASLVVAAGGGIVVPNQPDSAPVLRLDMDSRKLDTAGMVRIQRRISEPYRLRDGSISARTLTTPMPVVDDWAVLSDGSVAFVRHKDYHVDWMNPDGSRTSSPSMHFPWQPMSVVHKRAFIDSVRLALESAQRQSYMRYDSINFACFDVVRPPRPWMTPEEFEAATAAVTAAAAAVPTRSTSTAATASAAPAPTRPPNCPASQYLVAGPIPPVSMIGPDMLPDSKPPFAPNSTRTDADTNLWIRMNQMDAVRGTTLYDVINRKGELFDRVRIADERTLVGFGPGRVAFLTVKADSGVTLQRVRWK